MLLQYESDGRFRFQKQEHEYKVLCYLFFSSNSSPGSQDFSDRLREERDCFDQYVRDNILTDEIWNNRLAKADKAQSTFAGVCLFTSLAFLQKYVHLQKHCSDAIAAMNRSILKRYENFAELDTSPLGDVVLRRGPKLLRLVRAYHFCIALKPLIAGRYREVGVARHAYATSARWWSGGASCPGLLLEVNLRNVFLLCRHAQ